MHQSTIASHATALRIARPSRDLNAIETFYTTGLGLDVLYRSSATGPGESDLLMLGRPDAGWHLEITRHRTSPIDPTPTVDDLVVLYLGEPISEDWVMRLEQMGGRRVPAFNPYWDEHGVTVEDPDGYRVVLCSRAWNNAEALAQMDSPDSRPADGQQTGRSR